MPFIDVASKLGINMDQWLLLQSGPNRNKLPTRCHGFERELRECAHGIGATRARKECALEYEDFLECLSRIKTNHRQYEIRKQRDKLIAEGKYTPPPCHTGQTEEGP